jgi:hypothetical protein
MSISITNNPDGTFTVTCGTETVTIGAGHVPKMASPVIKPGRRGGKVVGGIVVAGFAAGAKLPKGTIPVSSSKALMSKLKTELSSAKIARAAGLPIKELHFSLEGQHTLDVGKVSTIAKSEEVSSIRTHIHLGAGRG